MKERDALNFKIVALLNLYKALNGQAQTDEKILSPEDVLGFTEAILTIFRTSPDPLTARNVRDRLVEIGFELGRYSNPLGFVHSALIRLHEQGKIRQPREGVYVLSSPFYRALFAINPKSPGVATDAVIPKQKQDSGIDLASIGSDADLVAVQVKRRKRG
jgi:hypothetical protein